MEVDSLETNLQEVPQAGEIAERPNCAPAIDMLQASEYSDSTDAQSDKRFRRKYLSDVTTSKTAKLLVVEGNALSSNVNEGQMIPYTPEIAMVNAEATNSKILSEDEALQLFLTTYAHPNYGHTMIIEPDRDQTYLAYYVSNTDREAYARLNFQGVSIYACDQGGNLGLSNATDCQSESIVLLVKTEDAPRIRGRFDEIKSKDCNKDVFEL
ncbi:MAG: hypothetical protein Q9201_000773 [Fulgogasparrea decipioides]